MNEIGMASVQLKKESCQPEAGHPLGEKLSWGDPSRV